jgi:hypothetical protein
VACSHETGTNSGDVGSHWGGLRFFLAVLLQVGYKGVPFAINVALNLQLVYPSDGVALLYRRATGDD